jgi:hypothetical protein
MNRSFALNHAQTHHRRFTGFLPLSRVALADEIKGRVVSVADTGNFLQPNCIFSVGFELGMRYNRTRDEGADLPISRATNGHSLMIGIHQKMAVYHLGIADDTNCIPIGWMLPMLLQQELGLREPQ